jgi:hypothetical protein
VRRCFEQSRAVGSRNSTLLTRRGQIARHTLPRIRDPAARITGRTSPQQSQGKALLTEAYRLTRQKIMEPDMPRMSG